MEGLSHNHFILLKLVGLLQDNAQKNAQRFVVVFSWTKSLYPTNQHISPQKEIDVKERVVTEVTMLLGESIKPITTKVQEMAPMAVPQNV